MANGSSGASAPDLPSLLAHLSGLDFADLRIAWRRELRTAPPDDLPRPLFLRLLAYRLQAKAWGDLDRESAKYLDRIAAERERQRKAGVKRRPKAVPPIAPVPPVRGLKPGTLLVREHGDAVHHVTVVPGGFAWNGTTYKSLSEIARLITGTNWNGPRFFGLRTKAEASRAAS